MAGVQIAAAINDENSTALLASTQLKAPAAAPLQQQLQQPSKQQQGSSLKSARKAFGNITNASAAKPQGPRRAFGDITNSALKPPAGAAGGAAGAATAKKAAAGSSFLFGQQQPTAKSKGPAAPPAAPPAAAAPSAQQASSSTTEQASSQQAQWWEGLEPERPAGKTWEQQEADREAALEEEARRSADEVWQGVLKHGCLKTPLPVAPVCSDDEEPFVFMPEEPSLTRLAAVLDLQPVPDVPIEDLMYNSDTTDFASLLPDIALPDEEAEDAGEAGTVPAQQQQLPGGCSSPPPRAAAAAADVAFQQQQTAAADDDCRSPDVQPW